VHAERQHATAAAALQEMPLERRGQTARGVLQRGQQRMCRAVVGAALGLVLGAVASLPASLLANAFLLYTYDAADDLLCVDIGGRRIIYK